MSARRSPFPALTRYDRVAQEASGRVIAGYSTSFGWASRLLDEPVRTHVRSTYALVRVADEIVDDPDPRLTPSLRAELLDGFEQETGRALTQGRSANLVVHAFALTARRCGIGDELVSPFFTSMRRDLSPRPHTAESLSEYIYGSAEVVGLMCLCAFVEGDPQAYEHLRPGARRLGAAFQKVNFLRDLADDEELLGRAYFPGIDRSTFTDADRDVLLEDIDADLAAADAAIGELPLSSRRAVSAAHGLYCALADRLRATPAAEIGRRRIRVPDTQKAWILARALTRRTG
ncbi:phytoene synthase [Brachybacterium sp. P6-10-X1]|uniref:phytoene/squalene synthase family protein n=1 Tax=Brachybacterium sp. P6-10-X1 TaxID=1903186 RepID=UPI00097198B7|nr:squalene/phytoene synthase family protein [Brachybacterium sp. P6-10-X1]APX33538.1 phytoene synthase [Brachybacterium sp. P6-10-X1]